MIIYSLQNSSQSCDCDIESVISKQAQTEGANTQAVRLTYFLNSAE